MAMQSLLSIMEASDRQGLGRIEKELHRRLTRGSAGEDARPGRQGARHPGKGTSNDSSVT